MARNASRHSFLRFSAKKRLKRFLLKQRVLQTGLGGMNFEIDNSAWQKRPFLHVFAHFSACKVDGFLQAKNQTPRAAMAIPACGVGELRLLRRLFRRFSSAFSLVCDVRKSSRKKVKWRNV